MYPKKHRGFLQTLLCLLILSTVISAAQTASKQAKKGKKQQSTPKRSKCKFFEFRPMSAPTIAAVEVLLENKRKVNETFKVVLNCPTLKIIDQPNMVNVLKPESKEMLAFSLIVDKNGLHTTPEVIQHQCLITKWVGETNDLELCNFNATVWPYGLFDYNCDDFVKTQVEWEYIESQKNKVVAYRIKDNTKKLGLFAIYMKNLTCFPALPLIESTNMVNKLRKEQPWNIEIPSNCSGVFRKNYVGKCHLEVFNLCHTQKTLVLNITFPMFDGEIDECEYLKERLGDLTQHPIAEFFGLNHVETGYLTLVVIIELFIIAITIAFIFIRSTQTKKDD